MAGNRPFSWLPGLLAGAPLIALLVWLAAGARSGSFGPDDASPAGTENSAASAQILPDGLPPPDGDFPADRLEERVDGAAERLRAAGCTRLLLWRLQDAAAEVELLIFTTADGAAQALARDAGPARTPGPGDEASIDPVSAFFRRGRVFARVLPLPGAAPGAARLLEVAERFDRGIRTARFAAPSDAGAP